MAEPVDRVTVTRVGGGLGERRSLDVWRGGNGEKG